MPLNKLENFIKNTEGRILYVNPNDLDATDAAENQGNSLTTPFKTIQRALIEAARFSYVQGNNNDLVEKTTILLFPGEHVVDNRPGWGIKDNSGAKAVSPTGNATETAQSKFGLKSTSIFDLTQEDNILYKFNSIHGGVIVPRGTSIVGLDLRKTKIRPKYVPNPTKSAVPDSAIFRITGACYFWQFSIFDGDEFGKVYFDHQDFSESRRAKPTFSHHKLTCFEYADGVNIPDGYDITDLNMYYAKLSNAFNTEIREIEEDWPASPDGFTAQRPEYEIVGAFAADPITITNIAGLGRVVTVTTKTAHELKEGTPIKIEGANPTTYNISTKVQSTPTSTTFTYLLNSLPAGLNPNPSLNNAIVTIETDTVSGASPYIFNCSLRSVYGMNGMHADGAKASGFRSMVVAQFTAVSLQKDDRAFVRYNQYDTSRTYSGITVAETDDADTLVTGSSSTNSDTVYHLDPRAVYRNGWETSHIKASNDAFIQIVSVFAIGFTRHFDARSGADYSVTNSNSNFGQLSLASSGFKKESFAKDNEAYITSVIPPRAITSTEEDIDWISIDVDKTINFGNNGVHLYLKGFESRDEKPPAIIQGYRVGARIDDLLYVVYNGTTYSAPIYMVDNEIDPSIQTIATGSSSSFKEYSVSSVNNSTNTFTIGSHNLITGEKVKVISDIGDLPENIIEHRTYYIIKSSSTTVKLASTKTNADNGVAVSIIDGQQLKIVSRVSDKEPGDVGSPIQYDPLEEGWYIHTSSNNDIWNQLATIQAAGLDRTDPSYVKRREDSRSIDEKLYKFRVVIPKQAQNAKDPEEGFVIQSSSSTSNVLFSPSSITNDEDDYDYNRNPGFIADASQAAQVVTVRTELPHNLNVEDKVIIRGVKSSGNTTGIFNVGYNGTFAVTTIVNEKEFKYSTTDVLGNTHDNSEFGTFTNDTSVRDTNLPRFERNDLKSNYYVYRSELITPHITDAQDGVYHIYVLNADNAIDVEFTDSKFSQNVTDLYPQLDRDNIDDNPRAAKTYAKRSPIASVVTNDLKKSVTRETTDKLLQDFYIGLPISGATASVGGQSTITFTRNHNLNGIVAYDTLNGGSGHTNGTYYNVKLFNDTGLSTWDGATAKVVVTGIGSVTSADIMSGGSGYNNGETLYFDTASIGGAVSASITIATSGISDAVGNTIQVTGDGTTDGGHYRITAIPSRNQVSIGLSAGDPAITADQYVINVAPEIQVSTTNFSSGISIYTTSTPHGLKVGNKIRILNSSNENLGDYLVTNSTTNTITVSTGTNISAQYILKHALSSNNGVSDVDNENLAVRAHTLYGNEILELSADTDKDPKITISSPTTTTTLRFEVGSYLQIEDEIMRVVSSTLTGSGNNEITVVRGVFGTTNVNHVSGSLVKKIKPLPIEFRRPSYVRASGHTFEYLGYGPGNYSTGLPQVQVTSLSEQEEYLAQGQERDCGIVVYTGMNSDGDFFIGNKKINSATGTETNFDIPVPTITGQDPSRLSEVFDELIIKERILVEGGNSRTILSQFDGPVKFTNETRFTDTVKIVGEDSTSTTSGALQVAGGLGVNETITATDVKVGTVHLQSSTNKVTTTSGNLNLCPTTGSLVAICTNTTITGILSVSDDITAFWSSDERLKDNITPINDPLAKVISISGNTFDWNDKSNKSGHDVGLIAQEIEKVLPEAVTTRDNGYLAVDYHKVVPLLVEAIKELSDKVSALEKNTDK